MRLAAAGLALVLAGCSRLATTPGGVASVVIKVPQPAEVETNGSIQLTGVAQDANGDVMDVPIYWRALDTTITVDSLTGVMSGVLPGTTGRVVARAVDLYSAIATFTVLEQTDTLIQVADSVQDVPAANPASPALAVQVEGGDPLVAVSGRRITFEVVSPVFDKPEDRTVEFAGGHLAISPTTGTLGTPSPDVVLQRRAGFAAPDTAIVRVTIYRPGGGTVPGSGMRFLVHFEP